MRAADSRIGLLAPRPLPEERTAGVALDHVIERQLLDLPLAASAGEDMRMVRAPVRTRHRAPRRCRAPSAQPGARRAGRGAAPASPLLSSAERGSPPGAFASGPARAAQLHEQRSLAPAGSPWLAGRRAVELCGESARRRRRRRDGRTRALTAAARRAVRRAGCAARPPSRSPPRAARSRAPDRPAPTPGRRARSGSRPARARGAQLRAPRPRETAIASPRPLAGAAAEPSSRASSADAWAPPASRSARSRSMNRRGFPLTVRGSSSTKRIRWGCSWSRSRSRHSARSSSTAPRALRRRCSLDEGDEACVVVDPHPDDCSARDPRVLLQDVLHVDGRNP